MKDTSLILSEFLLAVSADPRISIAHIGLYSILFERWRQQGFEGYIMAFASQVMVEAKISSTATYHKLIKQLDEYGYIRYEPSFYKGKKSRFSLINLK